ncbi:SDR family oxidoreductase [Micromonospora sp. NPDC005220]|uniref:SDR family oxidoreductase n=1 Tax=Micromonospora sp. NPDC005220 TaxID=3155589 RepID=UPI0033A74F73
MTAGTILLTGAAGVVGRALLAELTDQPVICLVHRGRIPPGPYEIVTGDLTRPQLGLPPAEYDRLAARVDTVVHSAALTEWGRPEAEYEAVNVEGTRQVIEFAASADASVHFISTAFCAALDRGGPTPLRAENVTTNYVRAKRAGELLLAGSGLAYSIYRPTNLVGHSRTGWTSRAQIVQLVADWIGRGRATLFPAHPGNLVDVVAQDLLARSVRVAIERGETGRELWLTYGKRAMTVEQAVRILVDHAHARGRPIRAPRIVTPAEIDPAEIAAMSPNAQLFMRVLGDVSEVTAACGGALPSSMAWLVEHYGLPDVSDVEAFQCSLRAASG